ncbi:MAG: hypothetical protein KTR25_14840 [Myxococcales bacterium]|nr:hypothetical protein [Myxococcales bacterium]
MRLSIASALCPAARQRFEQRFLRFQRHLRPLHLSPRAGARSLLVEAGLGPTSALVKTILVVVGALETTSSLARRDILPYWMQLLPKIAGSLASGVLFLGVGKLVAALQTALGVESKGRPLTDIERHLLRSVFHGALDVAPLCIKHGPCGLASLSDRPFVHGHVLYLHGWPLEPAILVHEAVHWWQYQHGGTDYMVDSICSQYWGKGYDWQQSYDCIDWPGLETEQQAQLVEDAFRAGFFETGYFEVQCEDKTACLESHLDALRSGKGAP